MLNKYLTLITCKYASDADYMLMAQRIVEMNALERQINMSTLEISK